MTNLPAPRKKMILSYFDGDWLVQEHEPHSKK